MSDFLLFDSSLRPEKRRNAIEQTFGTTAINSILNIFCLPRIGSIPYCEHVANREFVVFFRGQYCPSLQIHSAVIPFDGKLPERQTVSDLRDTITYLDHLYGLSLHREQEHSPASVPIHDARSIKLTFP
jgi:hypothetical protein